MKWLNPSILYFLALAIIPVIIHFLMREKVRQILFSAVRFLVTQSREILSKRKWLEWLLTALRMLAIILLVLAFARPFAGSADEKAVPKSDRGVVVVVLDASRSMNHKSRFADARAAAAEIIKSAPSDRFFQVVSFANSAGIRMSAPLDRSTALDEVNKIKETWASTDIIAAMNRVADTVAEKATEGEVHLVSDIQSTGIPRNSEIRKLPQGFKIKVHAVGSSDSTDGIVVSGGGSRIEVIPAQNNVSVTARILNYGRTNDVDIQLTINDKVLDSRRLGLPQNGEKAVTLTGTLTEPGEYPGQITVKGAKPVLKDDDKYNLAVKVFSKVRIAVVNGAPNSDPKDDAAFYIETALNAGGQKKSPYSAEVSEKLPPLKGFDVVILASVSSLPADDMQRLTAFVREGGGLFITLGPNMKPESFNSCLKAITPVKLRLWKQSDLGGFLVVSDAKHPLIGKVLGDGRGDLTTMLFRGAYELMDTQDSKVILRFDDNRIALLQHPVGKGSVMFFAGCLDRRTGDPLRAIFVPFVAEIVGNLSARGEEKAGGLSLGDSVVVLENAELTVPDRSVIKGSRDRMQVPLALPGIYRMKTAEKTELFAINVDPQESDLTSAVAGEIERMFAPLQKATIRKTSRGYERILDAEESTKAEKRLNLGWWCLFLVLGVVVSEFWLCQVVSTR